MVCRGPERLYCRSREAPAGRDAPARRTAEAAHANRVPRPPRLRRRRRGSGPPVLSTPAASTIPRGRTLSARPRLHRRVRLLPAPLPYTPLTIPIEIPCLPERPASDCEGACHGVRRRAHGARLGARLARAATVAAASGGGAVVGGGEHARQDTEESQRSYASTLGLHFHLSVIALSLAIFSIGASSDFIVS